MITLETKQDAEYLLNLLGASEVYWFHEDADLARRIIEQFPELSDEYAFLLRRRIDEPPRRDE